MIKSSAENYEPHRISNFLYDLSKTFHNYWSIGNIDENKKIFVEEDEGLTRSRIFLISAVKLVISKGLDILKINCPENM